MLQIAGEPDLGKQLIALEAQIDRLQVEASRLAFELHRSDLCDGEGFNSAIDWLRFNCHLTSTLAADRITVGEQLHRMPESLQAMNAGEIGYAHLKVMARTAEAVRTAFDEKARLPLARETSPGKFHYRCMHYRHSVDAEAYAREQADQELNHRLHLTTVESGHLLISGVLDPVGGAVVRGALDRLAQKSGVHDDRTLPRRHTDAFVDMASGSEPPNLQITASL
ncbi:MAG TPA: DUF222 domain-containing protein, partial [Candidatus Dormibacteraeota bacterium]|nr:DUF222 domain-containing protein [Candidatus Dormibacteraeota bacterium]